MRSALCRSAPYLLVLGAGCLDPALEPPPARGADAPEREGSSKLRGRLDVGPGTVPVWVDRPLDEPDADVLRAIVVLHGSERHAEADFGHVADVIPRAWEGHVVVVAPEFLHQDDAEGDDLAWDHDWRDGGEADGVSTFDVMDALARLLRSGVFPNLDWIVFAGHSAGGQLAQRYAAVTTLPDGGHPRAGRVKFVVANASSYVYPNAYRWYRGEWVAPRGACGDEGGYDDWKYGLEGLPPYAARRSDADRARAHLASRWVEILAGTDDRGEHDLDETCAAMWQGPTRFTRALLFDAAADVFYPANRTSLTVVPGVGHDAAAMFASDEGLRALFFTDDGPPRGGT